MSPYIRTMLGKRLEIPPQVAKAFVRDMKAFFKTKDQLKQDEIAARACWRLQQYQGPRDKKLRLTDVKEMFLQMKDNV